ncbi:MAG: hypothetical protein QOF18_2686 [Frankiaceae bacterium]|jgi:hypothetical protein|nr:hypothetical protein [Frankiaceae bacterium]
MSDPLPSSEDLLATQQAIAELAHRAAAASPAQGWNAGQVCAHLILNNGLFIETARNVAQGGPRVYDNESSVGDGATAALAAGAGAVGVLAEWLRQSVTAYVDLLTTLPDDVLDATVTTTIRHAGGLLVDQEPRRLGDLMVGQLTFHAGMHLEQVRQLVG